MTGSAEDWVAPILVTGFGPFQCHARNPSSEIASAIASRTLRGVRFVGAELETSWQRAWVQLLEAVRAQRPRALVLLGVCSDPFFRLEMVARNYWFPEADIDGLGAPSDGRRCLVEGAPEYYFSTLPFEPTRIMLGGSAAGIPIEISSDAGGFICNQVYYLSRHFLGSSIPHIGFVHVPPLYTHDAARRQADAQIVDAGISLLLQLTSGLFKSELSG